MSASYGFKLPNCGGMMCRPEWARPATILELAGRAQRLGYDSVWLHEHLLMPPEYEHLGGAHLYEPSVVMASVLASVANISVGTAAIMLPLAEPVSLARRMITMQAFHPGRAIFGFGGGQYESEFAAFGSDLFSKRGRVMSEYLRILDALFESGTVNFEGEFRTLSSAQFYPTAAEVGRPAIWIAGNASAAVKRAARFGDGWIGVTRSLAETQDAIATLRDNLGSGDREPQRRFDVAMSTTIVREDAGRGERAGGLHEHRMAIRGDCAEVRAALDAYAAVGVNQFIVTFGVEDLDALHQDLEWFAAEVITAPAAVTPT